MVCFVIAMISLVCLLSVIYTIIMNPKLQQHPSSLIGSICVFEGILVWTSFIECVKIGPIYINCYTKTHELLSLSISPFFRDSFDPVRAFRWIIYFNQVLMDTCQHSVIVLNICFCYDLIQTLSNPFEVAKSRLLIYLVISIVIPAIF